MYLIKQVRMGSEGTAFSPICSIDMDAGGGIRRQNSSAQCHSASGLWGGSAFAWFLCAGYMAMIFYLSSFSRLPIPSLFQWQDFLLHVLEYSVLGYLFSMAFVRSGLRQRMGLYTLVMIAAYGVTDELHQALVPLRDPSLRDVLADVVGGLVGMLIAQLSGHLSRHNRSIPTDSLFTAPTEIRKKRNFTAGQ